MKELQEAESKLQDEIADLKRQLEDCEKKEKARLDGCSKLEFDMIPPPHFSRASFSARLVGPRRWMTAM